ncbi:MAG: DUF1360 domain-containing protein [Candidatus Riesia sp.]|nr:DUF1360 domain-containing protein [Candidatus Riesia sp.]
MVELIKLSLATARLTNLLVEEAGPFDIFLKIREYFGLLDILDEDTGNIDKVLIQDENSNPIYTMFGLVLDCKLCTSVWVSMVLIVLSKIKYLNVINTILSVSMMAILINKGVEHGM